MNTISKSIFAVVVAALTVPVAMADNGFYVSAGVNSTTVEQSLSRNTGTNVPISPDTGAANGGSFSTFDQDTGASAFVSVGYRFEFLSDSFLEAEAFYADETAETQNLNSLIISEVELQNSFGLDVHLGKQVTDTVGIYGLMGVAQYEFDVNQSYPFAPPTAFVSAEETAFVYGAGVEISLTDHISTFGEVKLTTDLDYDTPVDQGGVRSINELDLNVIRTGIRYRF